MDLPRAAQRVIVRLEHGRELATRARDARDATVWLDLPAVVHPGAALALRWTTAEMLVDAHGHVRETGEPGLAVGVETWTQTERRRVERFAPATPLCGAIGPADGAAAACEVVDVSLGGVAVRVPASHAVAPGTRLALRLHAPGSLPALRVEVDVRSCRDAGDGTVLGCAFATPALAALPVAQLIRRVASAP